MAKVTRTQLKEIALKKMEDLNTTDIEQAIKIIEGTARNMGIEIAQYSLYQWFFKHETIKRRILSKYR